MAIDNVLISVIGTTSVGLAGMVSWRGRRLVLVAPEHKGDAPAGAAKDALRSLATCLTAGLLAGVLVAGLGGRLVMRILAATSGDDAQGRPTEADETVGEITLGGTLGFVLFVGIGSGLLAAGLYLLTRRVLPRTAAPAGLVVGVILLGSIGVLDPLSPDNADFVVLEPSWLAVSLVIAAGLLFGTMLTAVAARLERRWAPDGRLGPIDAVPVVLALVPPVALVALLYIGTSALLRGRAGVVLDRPRAQLATRVLMVLAVGATASSLLVATADILG